MEIINNYFESVDDKALINSDLVANVCDVLDVKLVCNDGKVVDFEIE